MLGEVAFEPSSRLLGLWRRLQSVEVGLVSELTVRAQNCAEDLRVAGQSLEEGLAVVVRLVEVEAWAVLEEEADHTGSVVAVAAMRMGLAAVQVAAHTGLVQSVVGRIAARPEQVTIGCLLQARICWTEQRLRLMAVAGMGKRHVELGGRSA